MNKKFTTCWITVNRACNLRCTWCYAKETGFKLNDELKIEDGIKIVDLCVELGIKTIILIGGEPTIYSKIFELIQYIKSFNIRVVLVTNGVILKDINLVRKYIDCGIDSFSISLKASNSLLYKKVTGYDQFNNVMNTINNLAVLGAKFSVTSVLTNENINNFLAGLVEAKNNGAKSFGLSFCYNFDINNETKQEFLRNNNPYILAKNFSNIYPEICEKLKGCSFSLEQSLPLCVWEKSFIDEMNNNGHLRSICQLLKGNGLLFDTDLNLIPCNAMYKLKYGKFGIDFNNAETLFSYINSEKIVKFFNKLRGVPDEECLKCSICKYCGGGCVTNWTNYSFDELKTLKERS
ncbi:MAG: radical SAM protein [Erysipelotrichaceae bacterium]|nr:radical SAM protein [Erysipelotrichaceae bacterium]